MKTNGFSENTAIRYESELVHHVSQLLNEDPDLHWRIPPETLTGGRPSSIELDLDDQTLRFKPIYSLKPGIPELETILKSWSGQIPPLLVAPELRPSILDFAGRNGWQHST